MTQENFIKIKEKSWEWLSIHLDGDECWNNPHPDEKKLEATEM